jgi:hypothetical protein
MIYLETYIDTKEFYPQYSEETQEEYFDQLHKDYLIKFKKQNIPLLPQELEKFCKILGFKKENPTKKEIVLFLLDKEIN